MVDEKKMNCQVKQCRKKINSGDGWWMREKGKLMFVCEQCRDKALTDFAVRNNLRKLITLETIVQEN